MTYLFSNDWKKPRKRLFCDSRKVYKIYISMSINKVLLEHSHTSIHSCSQETTCNYVEVRDCLTLKARNVYSAVLSSQQKASDPVPDE